MPKAGSEPYLQSNFVYTSNEGLGPTLLADAISTKISCTSPNLFGKFGMSTVIVAFLSMVVYLSFRTMCLEVFGKDVTSVKSVIPYTGLKLWLTVKFLQNVIAKETWGHGIGRHSKEDVWDIAVKDMEAISAFLGL